jgi:hypothetical protein
LAALEHAVNRSPPLVAYPLIVEAMAGADGTRFLIAVRLGFRFVMVAGGVHGELAVDDVEGDV